MGKAPRRSSDRGGARGSAERIRSSLRRLFLLAQLAQLLEVVEQRNDAANQGCNGGD